MRQGILCETLATRLEYESPEVYTTTKREGERLGNLACEDAFWKPQMVAD